MTAGADPGGRNVGVDPEQIGRIVNRLQRPRTLMVRAVGRVDLLGAWPYAACSVVGSIIFRTSVILVAGKPLISACLRMIASSFAR